MLKATAPPTRMLRSRSGLVAPWIDLDLAQILHRLPPEFLKADRQTIRQFAIPDDQRRESALLDEGMVQGQHHRLVVHDVKGMAELSGIADARHLSRIVSVHSQELYESALSRR